MHHHLPATATTAEQPTQQSRSTSDRSTPSPTLNVLGQHLLNRPELFPTNIARMGFGDQRQPLLRTFAAIPATRLPIHVTGDCFGFPVSVGTAINGIGEDA